ncbi:hypothetical protein CPB83DRAFT_754215 [Crepidotus variabilis]|uniref:rRNA biogenesis protein RRP36 n=1 Tax=Crepidotus variabilis TaxID=179855 RepID=A0A9P6JX44_9AGAR|nr:hypothetical protein CPB83DRAFT_754215 [Crepidotus variabilis]
MPRRPRPALRNRTFKEKDPLASHVKLQHPKPSKSIQPILPTSSKRKVESNLESENEFEEGSSQYSASDSGSQTDAEDEEDNQSDVDAPRVALWEEDNEDFLEESDDEDGVAKVPDEKALESNLQDLPLGALRRAQTLLRRAEPETDSGSSDDHSTDDEAPETLDVKGKARERVEWSTKPRSDLAKRSNKHAPTEMSAKRPVSRKRIVVDVPKIVSRDPRFLPTTGTYDPTKFQQSYAFLSNNRKSELQTLKETLKKARKVLSSSPRDVRFEREQEIERLERAVKRAESNVNRDRLDQVEREALSGVKKTEKEKQNQGKAEWFLKKGLSYRSKKLY